MPAKKSTAKKKSAKSGTLPLPYSNTKEQRLWQVRDALSTLERAGEIKNDRGLMREVSKLASERIQTLKSIPNPPKK
jgi:hypothetical protein